MHTISNYDSESNVSVALPQVSDTSETAELTGDFSVKEKVYDYEGNNIAILDVTNNTNKDLAVTITCTYLDGEGKEQPLPFIQADGETVLQAQVLPMMPLVAILTLEE